MCAVDGGVKVYEVLELPATKFDRSGVINMKIAANGDFIVGDDYLLTHEIKLIRRANPKIWRDQFHVYSLESTKMIGESKTYSRSGGGLIGPWHPSSYGCARDYGNSELLRRLFMDSKQGDIK